VRTWADPIVLMAWAFFCVPLCEINGWLMHQAMHRSRWPWLVRAHRIHHEVVYPPRTFLRDEAYIAVGDRSRFVLLGSVVLVLAWAAFPLLPFAIFAAEFAAYGLVNDYLHDASHVKGHWLERYRWFIRLRERHVLHHIDTSINLGISLHTVDAIAGTYEG
jgi:hypothetical protein